MTFRIGFSYLAKDRIILRATGEVAGEVTREVAMEVEAEVRHLLTVISGAMTRRELQAALQFKSEENFRQRYLAPALVPSNASLKLFFSP